jgi:hypothetical protein
MAHHCGWWVAAVAALLAACVSTPQIIDNTALASERDGVNWAAYGRTFSEGYYSPLTQITDQNVSRLGLAWALDLASATPSPHRWPSMASFIWARVTVSSTPLMPGAGGCFGDMTRAHRKRPARSCAWPGAFVDLRSGRIAFMPAPRMGA